MYFPQATLISGEFPICRPSLRQKGYISEKYKELSQISYSILCVNNKPFIYEIWYENA